MKVKLVKIKVLGKGSHGVVHLVKTLASIYNQIYAVNLSIFPILFNVMVSRVLSKNEESFTCSLRIDEQVWWVLDIHEKWLIHFDLKPDNILPFPPQHGTGLPTLNIADSRYYIPLESIVEAVSSALDIRDKLLRGESPNILEGVLKLGKSFLMECFTIDPNKR
ncbi:hypothetical protein CXB51_025481 [Gossypium anomalum]|uniref:Protein kinase domain-containing protein n=1 Tax=Gossypium anomalum TaxID=47600 RepID=A0A8J5Y1Y7_9ROSI|nr:hypothetical protein CXB51_025481 [Gossypium anomalum]